MSMFKAFSSLFRQQRQVRQLAILPTTYNARNGIHHHHGVSLRAYYAMYADDGGISTSTQRGKWSKNESTWSSLKDDFETELEVKFPRIISMPSISNPEDELTCGQGEEVIHKLTIKELKQMDYVEPNISESKFLCLIPQAAKTPEIIGMQRLVPPSDDIYHNIPDEFEEEIEFDVDETVFEHDIFKEQERIMALSTDEIYLHRKPGVKRRLIVPGKPIDKELLIGQGEGWKTYREKNAEKLVQEGALAASQGESSSNCEFPSDDATCSNLETFYDIYDGITHGLSNSYGRGAIFSMLNRAVRVCSRIHGPLIFGEPLKVENIGGGAQSNAGNCVCTYIVQDEITRKLRRHGEHMEYVEQSWDDFKLVGNKFHVPDGQVCRRLAVNNKYEMSVRFTADVKSRSEVTRQISDSQITHAWNQALVGLQYSNFTYGMIMSVGEARLFKIAISENNNIITSQNVYRFDMCDGHPAEKYQSQVFLQLFSDIVRAMLEIRKEKL